MRIGLLQLNATIGAFAKNSQRVLQAHREASALGAELTVAPELFLCGYPPRDLLLRADFVQRNLDCLEVLAQEIGPVPLLIGYVDRHVERPGRPLFNAAALLQNGKIVHRLQKSLLPTYDVFDEDRYFEPSPCLAPVEINGRRVAVTICEDIWNDADFWPTHARRYRADPVKELLAQGADLILNLSASPWQLGKEEVRLRMLQRVAKDEGVPLVQVNMVGGNDELIFDGHSVALDAEGEILALGAGFAEEVFVVDVQKSQRVKASPRLQASSEEQLYHTLVLGLRDYVQKCGFRSVLVGLSGGIDSALVATLAQAALGADQVWGISLPSQYSSPGSLEDAAHLAKNLGIRYNVLPISAGVETLEKSLHPLLQGYPPDSTEENLQARLRGTYLMALSNKFGGLLLTTGNKSEMAVGYCTLYGDMCGALAVIADVWKTQVYALAQWINREQPIIPLNTLTKPPSAELRPGQKDQDSLPPYEILDKILQAYLVEEADTPALHALGIEPEIIRDVLNKVTFSEYKRRQAAPGLRISARAFGMGRRIPIAQKFKV